MITATFLDQIDLDFPAANWGGEEWAREFATMRADGIDTVVLARGGLADRSTFDSSVLRAVHPHLIVQEDLVALFLSLCEQHDMSLWFGTYRSGPSDPAPDEARLNSDFVAEVWARYGRSRAFRGWYVSRPIDARDDAAWAAFAALSKQLDTLAGSPIMVTPRVVREDPHVGAAAWRRHSQAWSEALDSLSGLASVVRIEERGHGSAELPEFLATTAELARARGFEPWIDVEAFDREVGQHPPPIAWPKLRFKLESALAASPRKILTNEYSHCLSPHSMFDSGHMLHKRYREWLATQK